MRRSRRICHHQARSERFTSTWTQPKQSKHHVQAAPGFQMEQVLLDVVPNGLGFAGEAGGFRNIALGNFSSVGPFDIFGHFDTYLSAPLIATTETISERGTFADPSSVLGANNLG
jgi:hypothetical protein